ncbi:NADH-quinone oxidoreductase [Wolbachia pipientis]|uniref:NADH-quinone oxidoreductase subunit J n=1 Tax=Wolbachia pipientis TaxID=955 RepID=A0A1E7QJH9_WOLPI|nr:NADH-quinone oxidoreductase subunit J [Wolbachia pipientis]OEY86623.1 NADH-quinone oxidoreductase [Wolbachia pipientis]
MVFFFYCFAIFTILSSVCVISTKNPVHSVLSLILTFISTSALFIMIGAEFIAMMILIVYIGAVAVLFLFMVMMLDFKLEQGFAKHYVFTILLCGIFFLAMSFIIYNSSLPMTANQYEINNIRAIGDLLYTNYMYAFHISGILLLVAMVGAIALTLPEKKKIVKKSSSSFVKLVKGEFRKGIEWK